MDDLTREQYSLPQPEPVWRPYPPSTPKQQAARRQALRRDWRDETKRRDADGPRAA